MDPVWGVRVPTELRVLSANDWRVSSLAPDGDEAFDDGGEVVFGTNLQKVRVIGGFSGWREDTNQTFHTDIREVVIGLDEFRYILSSVIALSDAHPVSHFKTH